MPIPKPKEGEEKQDFISRCMGNDVMNREHPKNEERAGICYSQWENRGKKDDGSIAEDLIRSMDEEIKARNVYLERGKLANTDLYNHIANEESHHYIEFKKRLEGHEPAAGINLKVRYVGKDVLLDFAGMNPAVAEVFGFQGIAEDEILVLDSSSDAEKEETIQHERAEHDMLTRGIPYWQAHKLLMVKEDSTMKYKDAKAMAVKFADEEKGIIEGVYAPFGGPLGGKDLQGEYFDKDTDFCEGWFASRPILYHHGMDSSVKAEVIGHDIATKVLDNGRWLQAQLDKSIKYWKELRQLILEGKVFFSSGAVPHLVTKAIDGKLTRWPWVETSLTVSPANPMAIVDSLKAMDDLKVVGATEEQLAVIKPKDGPEVVNVTITGSVVTEKAITDAVKDALNDKHKEVEKVKDEATETAPKAFKDMSDNDKRELLGGAVREKFGGGGGDKPTSESAYVCDIYPTELIMDKSGKLYKVSYSVGEDGMCAFGEPEEVVRKTVYMPSGKAMKVSCPSCKAQFDVTMPEAAGTPAADPKVTGTEPKPAGDKQPAATEPGINQGMAPETHVASAGVDSTGQSGQHSGSTPAPAKPGGDNAGGKAADKSGEVAGKGETPKPVAANLEKEPEPPKAPTQASDNTASSTGKAPASKAIEEPKVEEKASEGLKSMLADHLKAVEVSVKGAVAPLEERLKALENQPADKGPIRRAVNPSNPLGGEKEDESASLKAMLDDPKTPAAVKAYLGEQLAAREVSDMIRQGPQRIGRRPPTAEQ